MPSTRYRPCCALKIGVVGNRRFGGENDLTPTARAQQMASAGRQAATAIWDATAAAVVEALRTPLGDTLHLADLFKPETPRVTVVSALAAGADQWLASAALQDSAGRPVVYELVAIMPFAESDYPGIGNPQPEFRPDEAETLRRLAAAARQVIRLDGNYADELGRQRAYEQTRDMLLQNVDLVVAMYDPSAPGGIAGTVETTERALAAGIPVLAVLLRDDDVRLTLYRAAANRASGSEEEWRAAYALSSADWRNAIGRCVLDLLQLPNMPSAYGSSDTDEDVRRRALAVSTSRLRLMFGDTSVHGLCQNRLLAGTFTRAWEWMLRVGAALSRARPQDSKPEGDVEGDRLTVQPYAEFYDRASELAGTYMRTYRGAFVLSFTLAGWAVAAAVALLAWSLLIVQTPPLPVVVALAGLKIGVILVLLVLERVSHHGRYQEHATDFRYLAEALRPMQWLAMVGTVVPAVELPPHAAPADPMRGWTQWLLRAIARSACIIVDVQPDGNAVCPREATLDRDRATRALQRARSEWVEGQIRYHRRHARRMRAIDEGLERLAKGLLWIVLACATIAAVLEITRVGHAAAVILGALAAALPAFIAACGGIMFQSEARRLRRQSLGMLAVLQRQQQQLQTQIARLSSTGVATGGEGWPTAQRLRALSALMMQETGDWKILYQTHEIHAG